MDTAIRHAAIDLPVRSGLVWGSLLKDGSGNPTDDLTGSGTPLTLAATPPAWASDGLTYDGSDDDSSITLARAWSSATIILAVTLTRLGVNNDRILALGNGTLNNRLTVYETTGTRNVSIEVLNNVGSVIGTALVAGGTSPVVITATASASAVTVRANLGASVTAATTGTWALSGTKVSVGNCAAALGISRPFGGLVRAVLIYDRVLSEVEQGRVYAFLRSRKGGLP